MIGRHFAVAASVLGVVSAVGACSGPADDETIELQWPRRSTFPPVAGVLGARCGSLDCHGTNERSFRVYSAKGLRLSSRSIPGGTPGRSGDGVSSEAEIEATYQSLVLLEPELLTMVIEENGDDPERLLLVRKSRGTEHHKGGAAAPTGQAADRCIVSWLTRRVDQTACEQGVVWENPFVME